MGTIQEEYVIIQLNDYEIKGIKKIDKFISKLPKQFQPLFFKCPCITNGYMTYFMNWDGSKEGWGTSEKADEIREKFKETVKKSLMYPDILHIKPKGEIFKENGIVRYDDY